MTESEQRDEFAKAALVGILASKSSVEPSQFGMYAKDAYDMAEAMLAEQERRDPNEDTPVAGAPHIPKR